MRIFVTDRSSIESGYLVRSSYAMISIRNSGVARARVPRVAGLRAVLHTAFDDAEPTESFRLPPDITVITPEHARRIWRFVKFHRQHVEAFVVHCHHGMSRSPAVAAAIAGYLWISDRPFLQDYMANRYVYRMMLDTMPT